MKELKNYIIRVALIAGLLFFLHGCTTTPLTNVRKKIVGTWIRTPIIPEDPTSVQKWTFTEDGYLFLVNNIPDTIQIANSGMDPSIIYSDSVDYDILRPLTKDYLYLTMPIPQIYRTPPPPEYRENDSLMSVWEASYSANLYIEKWEILKINKKVLHLSIYELCRSCGNGNNDLSLSGGRQIIFVRE